MISIRASVIATIAIVGFVLGSIMAAHGVARAAKADDPTTFNQDTATMNQDPALAERLFHIDWTQGAAGAGMSRITGYVYNEYGQAANDVELRITGLNAASQPVYMVFQHLRDTVPARGRQYFDLQVPISQSYLVDVASFDFTMGHGRN